MKRVPPLHRLLLVGIGFVAFGVPAGAQTDDGELEARFLRQQRLLDEQLDERRAARDPLDRWLDLQWGGWLEYFAFHYDDGVQESRFVQRPGMAFWTRIQMDEGAHEVFARLKLRYTWFDHGDEIDWEDDWWGPEFDQLWYHVDVGRALRLTTPGDPLQLRFRIGRQPVRFGTGYGLDLPMDAVVLDSNLGDVRVHGLFGRAIPNQPNIDRSEPVDSHSDRLFYGVQVAYEGFERHVPFVYALWNDDRTDEWPKMWFQDYSYDSFYVGFGSQGELAHNLNYWAEGVWESGHSFSDGAFLVQDYIEAWGWDVGVEKLFDVPTKPRIVAEYMFGSGDGDRLFSPTNAAGGNRFGTKDSSFAAFGFRDTGIALAPLPSNLHIWRLGASLSPLEHIELFRDFEIGTNWFLYHKHHARGAISDPTTSRFANDVGWEMDYFINWRLASDLSWTARWGTFFPGSAYRDRDCRHFVFTGLTWSF